MGHAFGYLDAPAPLAFAHRGAAAHGDENTADAFTRAVDLGYRYIETDVHATADGVAVIFHDETLHRVTGQPGNIATMRWRDLASIRIGGESAIPRLDETLSAWPDIRFNIDVKADNAIEPTLNAIGATAAASRVLLASFSDSRLARLRDLAGPQVATSLGMRAVARLRLASLTGGRPVLPPSVVAAQIPVRYRGIPIAERRFVAYAHRLGLHVHVWTVDEPTEIERLLNIGVDGIMTDRPDLLRHVYRSRGVWPES